MHALVNLLINSSRFLFCVISLELISLSVFLLSVNLSFMLFTFIVTMCVISSVLGLVIMASLVHHFGSDMLIF